MKASTEVTTVKRNRREDSAATGPSDGAPKQQQEQLEQASQREQPDEVKKVTFEGPLLEDGKTVMEAPKKTAKEQRKIDEMRKCRADRKKLYEVQEQKRRRREETAQQGRRSKEIKDGQTPLYQKTIRLKCERKTICDEYGNSGGSMKKQKKQKRKHKLF